jgi:hypothetical protein
MFTINTPAYFKLALQKYLKNKPFLDYDEHEPKLSNFVNLLHDYPNNHAYSPSMSPTDYFYVFKNYFFDKLNFGKKENVY